MHTRDAQPDDLPAVAAIYNASVPGRTATADLEPIPLKAVRADFDRRDHARRPMIIAEEDGRVVGYLTFKDFYGRPAYHATAEIGLYVHPDHHRRGVGAALLAHAVERAPTIGLRTLLAFTFAHNTASLKLLDRFGFHRWGELPDVADLDGVPRSLVIAGRQV